MQMYQISLNTGQKKAMARMRKVVKPGKDIREDTDLHDASKTVWPQPESPDTPGELPILRLTVRHLHLCQGPQQESSELATRKASG